MKNMIKILIATIFIVGSLVSCENDLNNMQQEENWGFDGDWQWKLEQTNEITFNEDYDLLMTIKNNKITNIFANTNPIKDITNKVKIKTLNKNGKINIEIPGTNEQEQINGITKFNIILNPNKETKGTLEIQRTRFGENEPFEIINAILIMSKINPGSHDMQSTIDFNGIWQVSITAPNAIGSQQGEYNWSDFIKIENNQITAIYHTEINQNGDEETYNAIEKYEYSLDKNGNVKILLHVPQENDYKSQIIFTLNSNPIILGKQTATNNLPNDDPNKINSKTTGYLRKKP